MGNDKIISNVLDNIKIEKIHNTALEVLEEIGVKVSLEETRELLAGIGAKVEENDMVKIPPELVRQAIKTAPKDIVIYDREGNEALKFDRKKTYFSANANLNNYLNPDSGEIEPLKDKHARDIIRLNDYLPNIDFVACASILADEDISFKQMPRKAFVTAVKNTTKPIIFATDDDIESTIDIIEMASIICGGKNNLRKKPFIFQQFDPISPLIHSKDACEKLKVCGKAGVPVVYLPYCMMGGTAPLSYAGTLVQCFAEIWSGLVISQAYCKGAPYIIGCMPSTMDMKTTIGTYGAPEFHLMSAACADIAHYYKFPFYGTAGCTDSKRMDYQTVMESTFNIMTSIMNNADMTHDVGYMFHGDIISPELIVLTNEIINMVRAYKNGIEVNEKTLCKDVIKDIGPGGHYLQHEHTYENFKKVWYSELLDHSMEGEPKTLNEKINSKTIEILENHKPQALPENIEKQIIEMEDEWIKKYN